MRVSSLVLGVIGLLAGGVFALQGAGVLPGSFMTGQRLWLVIGVVVAIIGLALTYLGIRRPARS
jgi:amino acid transporter